MRHDAQKRRRSRHREMGLRDLPDSLAQRRDRVVHRRRQALRAHQRARESAGSLDPRDQGLVRRPARSVLHRALRQHLRCRSALQQHEQAEVPVRRRRARRHTVRQQLFIVLICLGTN